MTDDQPMSDEQQIRDRTFETIEELVRVAESDPDRLVRVSVGEVTIGRRRARLRLETSMDAEGNRGPVKIGDLTWLDSEASRGDA